MLWIEVLLCLPSPGSRLDCGLDRLMRDDRSVCGMLVTNLLLWKMNMLLGDRYDCISMQCKLY